MDVLIQHEIIKQNDFVFNQNKNNCDEARVAVDVFVTIVFISPMIWALKCYECSIAGLVQ